ncbi:MAG: TetR/AcrR family transcriptional regulator [Pseudomonadota bacterium]
MDRTEHYQDTRERILGIGQTLVSGRGFSALGLSEILTKAEVPKGSFYHYFQSKEGFGVALLERYFDNYLDGASLLLNDQSIPVRARLLTYFANWRQVAASSECSNMCLAVKLAAEVADLSEPMRLALTKGMQRITAQIAGTIRAAQENGQFPSESDAVQLAESLYGMWVGASLLTKVSRSMTAMDLAYKQTEQMLSI